MRADRSASLDPGGTAIVKGGDMASRDPSPAISGACTGKASAWPPERHARLLRLVALGLSGSEIGADLGVSRSAVLGYCHRNGVTLPFSTRKRELCGNRGKRRKLSDAERARRVEHMRRVARAYWDARA